MLVVVVVVVVDVVIIFSSAAAGGVVVACVPNSSGYCVTSNKMILITVTMIARTVMRMMTTQTPMSSLAPWPIPPDFCLEGSLLLLLDLSPLPAEVVCPPPPLPPDSGSSSDMAALLE